LWGDPPYLTNTEGLRPILQILNHALHQVPQGAIVDRVLRARPPARVRVPSRAIRVDRDPAVPADEPPDEQVRIYGGQARRRPRSTRGSLPGSPSSHRRICDVLPSGRRRLIRGRGPAPAPTSISRRGSCSRWASGTWRPSSARGPRNRDNSVGHDRKGSPPPDLDRVSGHCGSGGGPPSDLGPSMVSLR